MLKWLVPLLPLLAASSISGAQVQGVCVSGCYIPNPQQQQQTQPDLKRNFHFQAVQESKDFWLREAMRPEALPTIPQANLPIREQTALLTGPDGSARFGLSDGTSVTLGPGTEVVIDRFERQRDDLASLVIRVVKGKMRWQHAVMLIKERILPSVRMPSGSGAVRGTDFEIAQEVDGSGYVRVYDGLFTFTEYDSGRTIEVNAGQTLRFENFEIVGVE